MEAFKNEKVTESVKSVYFMYRYTPYSKEFTTHRMPVPRFFGKDVVEVGLALLGIDRSIIRSHTDNNLKVRFSPLKWTIKCQEGGKIKHVNMKYFYTNMKMVFDEEVTIFIEGSMRVKRRKEKPKPSVSVPQPDTKSKPITSVSKPDVQGKPKSSKSVPKPDAVKKNLKPTTSVPKPDVVVVAGKRKPSVSAAASEPMPDIAGSSYVSDDPDPVLTFGSEWDVTDID